MGGRAEVVGEDRVLAMLALACVTRIAAVQAAGELEPPVPAAGGLQEVAADRADRAQLRRRGEAARLAEGFWNLRIGLQLAERRPGADRRPVNPPRDEVAEIDERIAANEPVAKQGHEVGPAAEQQAVTRHRELKRA